MVTLFGQRSKPLGDMWNVDFRETAHDMQTINPYCVCVCFDLRINFKMVYFQ